MKKKEKLKILFEDKNLLIVNKPSGLPTIKSEKYRNSLYSEVFDYLHKKNQKVFIVHRLDADTSGIVVFAKNEKIKDNLQLNWDNVSRKYLTIVHGQTKDSGVIESYLKQTKTLYTYSTNDKSGKYARTEYKKLSNNKQYTMLEVDIKTGRKNQIRVHMKDNNTPILGDKKYGIKDGYRNMLLYAYKISLVHPITRERINIELDIPELYKKIINKNETN